MRSPGNSQAGKIIYFRFNAPWTGALVAGVAIGTLSLIGIFNRLGPISREAEVKWLCKQWESANPEPSAKYEKLKAYKKLKEFTGAYEAFRFCQ